MTGWKARPTNQLTFSRETAAVRVIQIAARWVAGFARGMADDEVAQQSAHAFTELLKK